MRWVTAPRAPASNREPYPKVAPRQKGVPPRYPRSASSTLRLVGARSGRRCWSSSAAAALLGHARSSRQRHPVCGRQAEIPGWILIPLLRCASASAVRHSDRPGGDRQRYRPPAVQWRWRGGGHDRHRMDAYRRADGQCSPRTSRARPRLRRVVPRPCAPSRRHRRGRVVERSPAALIAWRVARAEAPLACQRAEGLVEPPGTHWSGHETLDREPDCDLVTYSAVPRRTL